MIPLTQGGCDSFTSTFYLAFVAWREARSAKLPNEARLGVMFTILDRVARQTWYGKTVAEVAAKKWQFSSLTDPKDRQLTTWPIESDPSWFNCVNLAMQVGFHAAENPVPGCDHYFDDSIPPPDWATPDKLRKKIGNLDFYDIDVDHEAVAIVAAIPPATAPTDFEKSLRDWLAASKGN